MLARFLIYLLLTALTAAAAAGIYLIYWIATRRRCEHCGRKLCDCEWDEYW